MDKVACELVSAIFRGDKPDRDGVLSYLGKHATPYMSGGRVCWRDAGVFHFDSRALDASFDREQAFLLRGDKVGRIGVYDGEPAVLGEDVCEWEEVCMPVGISARECCAPEYAMYRMVRKLSPVTYYTVYTRVGKRVLSDLRKFVPGKKLLRNPTEERALKYLNK